MKRLRSNKTPKLRKKIPRIANEDSSADVEGRIVPGSYFKDPEKKTEVLYPAIFDDTHPAHGHLAHPHPATLMWDEGKDFTSVPICQLSHITHNEEAIEIEEFCYKFKAFKKMGKTNKWDNSPPGETYRRVDKDTYEEICGEPVFPGYLSWWGISVKDWYSTEDGKRLKQKVQKSMAIVPDYLQTPARSRYGNNAFIMSLKHAMDCYKDSRKDCASQSIYLKKAGTLRYRYEICYVILVCMEEDLRNDTELGAMPSMHGEPIFEHNGYIDEHGMIINPSAVPVFNTKHVKEMRTNHSWENIAFAFYFNKRKKGYLMGRDVSMSSVKHKKCISTQQREYRKKWVCPNEI